MVIKRDNESLAISYSDQMKEDQMNENQFSPKLADTQWPLHMRMAVIQLPDDSVLSSNKFFNSHSNT